jgi:hypothetical protein
MRMNISVDVIAAAVVVSTGCILVLALASMPPRFIELKQGTIGDFFDKYGLCIDGEDRLDIQQARIITILAQDNLIGRLRPPIIEVYPSSGDFNCTVILVGVRR